MGTIIYFVRHADSPYIEGQERARGLSEAGAKDALKVRDILALEGINVFYSSPYERAIRTILPAADHYGMDVLVEEDLRERMIGDFNPLSFWEAKQQVYNDFSFFFPQGESSLNAQERAVTVLLEIINKHNNQRVVVGTHGDIMTLMLNALNKRFDFGFWQSTSMPDIYKVQLIGQEISEIKRLYER
ncbi:histidine phosphatase family protein [Paenibacillus dakarensis]|uniref:histidine phosphatase family protein n=1 Tax=Paenibacillus dakarensis TaxID=1527293 RepID=UPI0006D562A2|nr:histidine phosphatase family protein [Paenibacillus dakarensis]